MIGLNCYNLRIDNRIRFLICRTLPVARMLSQISSLHALTIPKEAQKAMLKRRSLARQATARSGSASEHKDPSPRSGKASNAVEMLHLLRIVTQSCLRRAAHV